MTWNSEAGGGGAASVAMGTRGDVNGPQLCHRGNRRRSSLGGRGFLWTVVETWMRGEDAIFCRFPSSWLFYLRVSPGPPFIFFIIISGPSLSQCLAASLLLTEV